MRGQETRIRNLESRIREPFDETGIIDELPGWLTEFTFGVLDSLDKPKNWRNPEPSIMDMDEVKEYLEILKAPHLFKLFEGMDRWTWKILVRIMRAAAEKYLSEELKIGEEQARIDLQYILKHRGYSFYQPDPLAWGRLSPQAQAYYSKVKPPQRGS